MVPASGRTAEKPKPITNPQPGLLIFNKGLLQRCGRNRGKPKSCSRTQSRQNLTDAEKLAFYEQWRAFAANSGTYEIKGSTLTRRPSVAKNVGVMSGQQTIVTEFKMDGPNTLWLIPPADRPNDPRAKWTRVE